MFFHRFPFTLHLEQGTVIRRRWRCESQLQGPHNANQQEQQSAKEPWCNASTAVCSSRAAGQDDHGYLCNTTGTERNEQWEWEMTCVLERVRGSFAIFLLILHPILCGPELQPAR